MAQKQASQSRFIVQKPGISRLEPKQMVQKMRFTLPSNHESEEDGWFSNRSQQSSQKLQLRQDIVSGPKAQKQVIVVPANQVQLHKSKQPVRQSKKEHHEDGTVSDTLEEHFQIVEHEISGEMAQPHKSQGNKQALQNVKKLKVMKNHSDAKLDYQLGKHEPWNSGYQSANSAPGQDWADSEADVKQKINGQKVIKKKRQKFIQPSLANSAQATIDQPYSNSTELKGQPGQTKSMNQLIRSSEVLANTVKKLTHQFGALRLQDLQDPSQSLSNGEINRVLQSQQFEPNSAQKVKHMIKLVKSSAKKLQNDQLTAIRETVKAAKQQFESKDKPFVYKEKQEDCPTPKASSRIILRASKANNTVNTQPPLKKQRGSQDSHTIHLLAKELQKKTVAQKLKIKQKSLNQSHNVNSAEQPLAMSHREYSNENIKITSSPKTFTLVKRPIEGESDADTVQKKYPSLRLSGKLVKQELHPVDQLRSLEAKFDMAKHESRLDKVKMQKVLSKTARFPPGFAEIAQTSTMRIEIQDISLGQNDLNKTQQVRFTGSGRTPGKELQKMVSPKKMDQANKGILQLQGDQQSMRQSLLNIVDNVSALSSFTTPSLDLRLNEIQKIERTQQSLGTLMFHPSNQEPNFFIRQLALNPKEISPSRIDQESNEKTSLGESDSLDVDEEICTRSHFDKLKELHLPKPRASQIKNEEYQPENVRESRRVSDARDLMSRQNEREQNNRIVSAGNDAFSSRVDQLKSEAEKADQRHKGRLKVKEQTQKTVDQEQSKIINTSIQPRNKSKFFNPTENMYQLAQNGKQTKKEQPKTKSALSEIYPTSIKGPFAIRTDESPTPPGHTPFQPAILPARIFGSRKQSHMFLNYFKAFLLPQTHLLSRVMVYLPLDACFRLKLISLQKSITRDPTLRGSFEVQFFLAMINHRRAENRPSKLSTLLAQFLSLKFHLTREQEHDLAYAQTKQTKRVHLNMSADTASMTGIAFEIQKDVDRTFQDQGQFSQQNRLSLATVLKTFASIDQEIGYVQGLNFIVGNFILLFDRLPDSHKKRTERRALASFLGILKVLKTRHFYTENMSGIKEAIFKLECILYNLVPEVYIYLMQNQITLEYFVSQWFLTLFQYDIDNNEQCMMIILLSLFFGEKILFQVAFQMIKEIRSRLVNFTYEEALVYLKDYAGESRFTKVEFLMRALENDLITAQLVKDLSKIYSKFQGMYTQKEIQRLSFQELNPFSQRVRFLRDSMPGKINVKVIWPKTDVTPEQVEEYKSDVEVQVTEFKLHPIAQKSHVSESQNITERETTLVKRPQNLKPGPPQLKPKLKMQSLVIVSEESRKNKPVQHVKFKSKRIIGSFAQQIGSKPKNGFTEKVIEVVGHQTPDVGFHHLQLAKGRSEVKVERISQVLNEEESEQTVKTRSKLNNSSLFERLGIQTTSVPLTSSQNFSQQRNRMFSLMTSNQKQAPTELSHRSSERPSYFHFPLKQYQSSRTSEESSHKSQRIKIMQDGTFNSSSSKTHSDQISQETDLLESENSFPLMLRVQQSSGMRMHNDQRFEEEELMIGNEYSTIEPPLFLSPQASNQINSRAIYSKDNQRGNFQVYERNILSAKSIKNEPVRPGTKTKLDQRTNLQQPTQSNFDIESETLTNRHAQSSIKFPTSPTFNEQAPKIKKVAILSGLRMQPSENIVESDKRMKQVNNIALIGAGFDNLKGISRQSPSNVKPDSSTAEIGIQNPLFEHLPLKDPSRFKQQSLRLSLPKTPEPVPVLKTIEIPLPSEKLSGNGFNPSHQMQGLRSMETKKKQLHRNSSQLTEEEQPQQQNAPVFIHKFLAMSKESKVIQLAEQVSARSGDSFGSPLNLDDRLPLNKNKSHFANFNDQLRKGSKAQVNYNTREQFSTIRFATQQKNYQVQNQYPQPKSQVETPNMTQTLVRPLVDTVKRKA